ncbi:MAG: SMC-Scp complex subunit ScpB [Clostridia bacterium]|nr:SMC-Scp complex subunit ScpB [Clostridia bacterium]
MKKNKTAPAPEQERMDLPGLGENENERKEKPENRPLEEPKSYEEAIEAILFAAGHPVSYEALAKTFDLTAPIIRKTVKEYAEKYNHSKVPRGVILLALDDECQLCTKAEYLAYIRYALGIRRNGTLSASTLETLAIVAYHQPVTRAYIDAVRGVDSSYAVSSLVERGLIEAKGRLDAPGRPVLFGTTSSFLRCFGLDSIDQLPDLPNDEITAVFQTVQDRFDAEEIDPNQLTIEDAEARAAFENEPKAETAEEAPAPEVVPEGEEPDFSGDDEPGLPFAPSETVTQHAYDDDLAEATPELIFGKED